LRPGNGGIRFFPFIYVAIMQNGVQDRPQLPAVRGA